MSSCEDLNIASDKIINSYDCTASYLIFFLRVIRYSIGSNLSTYFLKVPSTPQMVQYIM